MGGPLHLHKREMCASHVKEGGNLASKPHPAVLAAWGGEGGTGGGEAGHLPSPALLSAIGHGHYNLATFHFPSNSFLSLSYIGPQQIDN